MTKNSLPPAVFSAPIAHQIWDAKYRYKRANGVPVDVTVEDTWQRAAHILSTPEPKDKRGRYEDEFMHALSDWKFLPAGRITAGVGTGRNVTLFNCLAAETRIPTAEYGVVPISDVAGEFVHVIDGNGSWQLSKINEFGDQACASVHLKGGYNGREKRTVRATGGHRWIMQGGEEKVTDTLNPGDVLKLVNRAPVEESADYYAGIAHGITYGDGTRRYVHGDGSTSYCVRLCGEKTELFGYLEKAGWRHTQPPSFGDDILAISKPMHLDLKSCPSEAVDVEYLTGFMHGWMATDGCVCERDKRAMISCGAYEADWLARYGPVAGMEVAYKTKLGDSTNYGTRNIAIFNVSFKSWTLTPNDFLRTKHKENFGETRNYPWVVEAVDPVGEPEPVFCPRVLTTDSVQLTDGIHTGQCFVMGTIPDSMDGIFSMLREAALTMQAGGGIGYDFSTIRPKSSWVKGVDSDASGPLSFMDVWDAMCRTVMSAGSRRGAMMATMRCDHPDIEDYIEAKAEKGRLRMFNLSVLVTDDFMDAVKANGSWDLKHSAPPLGVTRRKRKRGEAEVQYVHRTVRARDLWDKIMQSTYRQAEPGVIFIDRINKANNLRYAETIASTNPCGEQPLPPYGACLLGSINLAKLVRNPFTDDAYLDVEQLNELVCTAVRMMDNVVDVSKFPLEAQELEAKAKRRIGLGVTGLHDALCMVGLRYGSDDAVLHTESWMKSLAISAYSQSVELAKEKGAFPLFNAGEYLAEGTAASTLPTYLKNSIQKHGIRNALLTSIAPTGTISLYAGNVSSGIEPMFAYSFDRKVLEKDGSHRMEHVEGYSVAEYRKYWEENLRDNPHGFPAEEFDESKHLPDYFVNAQTLEPLDHVRMQAAAQKWVDSSISKTINCPEDISFESFKDVYMAAWDSGCKGCTTYRPNEITGSVLSVSEDEPKLKTVEESTAEAIRETSSPWADEATYLDHASGLLTTMRVTHGHKLAVARMKNILADFDSEKAREVPVDSRVEFIAAMNEAIDAPASPNRAIKTPSAMTAPYGEPAREKRPHALSAEVYKIKVGDGHALYVTITDLETVAGKRPFEIFISTKDPEHFAWTTALTRMVSAVFQRPHDSSFVVEELKAVFSPNGGGWWNGQYVHSEVMAIGMVIEEHMKKIGYGKFGPAPVPVSAPDASYEDVVKDFVDPNTMGPAKTQCRKCLEFAVVNQGGCPTCLACGDSKCG